MKRPLSLSYSFRLPCHRPLYHLVNWGWLPQCRLLKSRPLTTPQGSLRTTLTLHLPARCRSRKPSTNQLLQRRPRVLKPRVLPHRAPLRTRSVQHFNPSTVRFLHLLQILNLLVRAFTVHSVLGHLLKTLATDPLSLRKFWINSLISSKAKFESSSSPTGIRCRGRFQLKKLYSTRSHPLRRRSQHGQCQHVGVRW